MARLFEKGPLVPFRGDFDIPKRAYVGFISFFKTTLMGH